MMVYNDTLATLRDLIRKDMDHLANQMIEGACGDFAEYRFYVGKIDGLANAEAMLLELDEKLRKAEES